MSIVLIAEDDEGVRVIMQSIVEGMGHICLTAANVEEALALLNGGTRALFVDGSDFLPKPYTVPQLTEAVNRMLPAVASNSDTLS